MASRKWRGGPRGILWYMAWLQSVVVSVLVFIGSLFGFGSVQSPQQIPIIPMPPASSTEASPVLPKTADFRSLTSVLRPQFVDRDDSDLSDKMRNQIIQLARAILVSNGDVDDASLYEDLSLMAVGKRYVLLTRLNSHSADDIIVDLGAATSTTLRYNYSFKNDADSIVYVIDNNIYTYTIDSPSFVELLGAKLGADESYNTGEGAGVNIQETHTGSSLTVCIYDFDDKTCRDATFALP